MQITANIKQTDALYSTKRTILQKLDIAPRVTFDLTLKVPLSDKVLPFLRLANVNNAELLKSLTPEQLKQPISEVNEAASLAMLRSHLQTKLDGYRTTIDEDTSRQRATLSAFSPKPKKSAHEGMVETNHNRATLFKRS
eukprot:scaffold175978_cov43-Prasinocladus_malaysianus.AAC.1